jgi:hypothetical protein
MGKTIELGIWLLSFLYVWEHTFKIDQKELCQEANSVYFYVVYVTLGDM